jgi:osmotically inducible lipoprotein OsmB
MKSLRTCVVFLVIGMSGLAGCGTISGAVIGGAAGHAIGGDTTSTVGGAVLGGMIGNKVSR